MQPSWISRESFLCDDPTIVRVTQTPWRIPWISAGLEATSSSLSFYG
ncbi:MAG: hypothetical protein JXR73_06920 [Candidatus Omnitrophica bacterium]|nr:hypothetical protein [Candidatus Omnitrophota bacterium]